MFGIKLIWLRHFLRKNVVAYMIEGDTFMKRNIRLEDISDGKLYTANDLVKADCHDCEGCSACCSGMASIVLDPLDVWSLCTGLGKAF